MLVGRRDLRSNNSWMHNLPVLVKGKARCTVHVHPDDAPRLGVADGADVRVRSDRGRDRAAGRGHRRGAGGRREHPARVGSRRGGRATFGRGARRRCRTRTRSPRADLFDPLSGNAVLNGIPVELAPLAASSDIARVRRAHRYRNRATHEDSTVRAGDSDVIERGLLDASAARVLADWASDIESWPAGSHVWGQYAEQTPNGAAICRTENVSACHRGVAALVAGSFQAIATARLGEPAVAFKDKLNFKQPGGAGFRPHQDAVAYPGVDRVVSLLVAVDECSRDSGCIWLAAGVDQVLPVDDRGVVRADVCDTLTWRAAELAPGDAVCIDGFAPHYSDENRTAAARRVLVASYTTASSGYSRAHYYDRRAETMHANDQPRRPVPYQHARRLRRCRSPRRRHRDRDVYARSRSGYLT